MNAWVNTIDGSPVLLLTAYERENGDHHRFVSVSDHRITERGTSPFRADENIPRFKSNMCPRKNSRNQQNKFQGVWRKCGATRPKREELLQALTAMGKKQPIDGARAMLRYF